MMVMIVVTVTMVVIVVVMVHRRQNGAHTMRAPSFCASPIYNSFCHPRGDDSGDSDDGGGGVGGEVDVDCGGRVGTS